MQSWIPDPDSLVEGSHQVTNSWQSIVEIESREIVLAEMENLLKHPIQRRAILDRGRL